MPVTMRSWYSYTRRLWRLPNSINQPINHSINQSIATALDAVATKGHVLWLRYYPIDLTNPSPQPLVNNKRTLQASREGGGGTQRRAIHNSSISSICYHTHWERTGTKNWKAQCYQERSTWEGMGYFSAFFLPGLPSSTYHTYFVYGYVNKGCWCGWQEESGCGDPSHSLFPPSPHVIIERPKRGMEGGREGGICRVMERSAYGGASQLIHTIAPEGTHDS